MKDIGTVKIHCISEALSPLTHMMGVSGNESIINREYVLHDGTMKSIPVISGNAIRHKMVREPGALFLVDTLGLRGKLTIDQANYLFTGGSLSESSISDNLRRIADMQILFPLLRLLGGSLRNQVVGGSLFVLRGVMVCEENRYAIEKSLPDGFSLPEQALKSCEDYVRPYQYTRGEAARRSDAGELLDTVDAKADSNLMIYAGQSVIPGALFYHGFVLYNVSRLEIGAMIHSLRRWAENDGTIGGMARIGHGRLNTSIVFEPTEDFFGGAVDADECASAYVEHVENHAEACVAWLNDAFSAREKKK